MKTSKRLRVIDSLFLLLMLSLPQVLLSQTIVGVPSVKALESSAERFSLYLCSGRPSSLRVEGKQTDRIRRYQSDPVQAQVSNAQWQNGSWTITSPEVNVGYVLESQGQLPRYIYLIDYTPYYQPIGNITTIPLVADPCSRLLMSWENTFSPILYFNTLGEPQTLARRLALSWQDLHWNSDQQTWVSYQVSTEQKVSSGNQIELLAPLSPTNYRVEGDLWAKELGLAIQEQTTATVSTNRVEVHPIITNIDRPNSTIKEVEQAPLALHLKSNANTQATVNSRWIVEQMGGGQILNYQGEETDLTITNAGSYRILLEVSNASGGCSTLALEQQIRIAESKLDVPNAFSPKSSPGVNDVFRVLAQSLKTFDARIFNAQGQELYHWTNPSGGWDGKYRGRYVPNGVYYYSIQAEGADGIKYHRQGHINILEGIDQYGASH